MQSLKLNVNTEKFRMVSSSPIIKLREGFQNAKACLGCGFVSCFEFLKIIFQYPCVVSTVIQNRTQSKTLDSSSLPGAILGDYKIFLLFFSHLWLKVRAM